MTIYAFHTTENRDEYVPPYTPLLVTGNDAGTNADGFDFVALDGTEHFALWRGSAHAIGDDFYRVYGPEALEPGTYAVFFELGDAGNPDSGFEPRRLYRVDEVIGDTDNHGKAFRIGGRLCLERGCAHIKDADWTLLTMPYANGGIVDDPGINTSGVDAGERIAELEARVRDLECDNAMLRRTLKDVSSMAGEAAD